MNNRPDKFSKSMMNIPPSGIRKFFEMLIGHDDVISLSVGEPDFPTPWVMREEAFYHLEKGHTSYTSNWGLIELREEISKYMERYELYYNPKNEILVTVGASEGVDASLRAILNPGDELIVVQPCYVNYVPLAELCQVKVIPIDSSVNGYYPTAQQIKDAITPKTKAVMICSPNNPTGTMIPAEELEKIAKVIVENQLWCISDEIYCELHYEDAQFVPWNERLLDYFERFFQIFCHDRLANWLYCCSCRPFAANCKTSRLQHNLRADFFSICGCRRFAPRLEGC